MPFLLWRVPATLQPLSSKADAKPANASGEKPYHVAVPVLRRIANFDDLDPLVADAAIRVTLVEAGSPLFHLLFVECFLANIHCAVSLILQGGGGRGGRSSEGGTKEEEVLKRRRESNSVVGWHPWSSSSQDAT